MQQAVWYRRLFRIALLCSTVIALCSLTYDVSYLWRTRGLRAVLPFARRYPSKDVQQALYLDEEACRATFPGLTKEIDDVVSRGPFVLKKEPDDYIGMVQARLENGKLYLITAEHKPSRDMLFERDAVLNQLYRAILTSPTPLPDTIFTFSITDTQRENGWSFARSNDPNRRGNFWLMPHFSFWSWPKPFIGTMDEALSKIDLIEEKMTWDEKFDKAVWRGTGWFNSVGNQRLRPDLLNATRGKEWADVEVLSWTTNANTAKNSINIEDFCKYKYIIYTEGITYSGRLPFHTACNSVIITTPITFLMHTTHFMRPLYSSSLPFSPAAKSKNQPPSDLRWPKSYKLLEANVVFVDPEWKDLEETIRWLQDNEDVARGIAKRQRELIGDGGYLSPAAEVCYWRSLIRGWHQVARPSDDLWDGWDLESEAGNGMRFETFSLTGKVQWDQRRSSRGGFSV